MLGTVRIARDLILIERGADLIFDGASKLAAVELQEDREKQPRLPRVDFDRLALIALETVEVNLLHEKLAVIAVGDIGAAVDEPGFKAELGHEREFLKVEFECAGHFFLRSDGAFARDNGDAAFAAEPESAVDVAEHLFANQEGTEVHPIDDPEAFASGDLGGSECDHLASPSSAPWGRSDGRECSDMRYAVNRS